MTQTDSGVVIVTTNSAGSLYTTTSQFASGVTQYTTTWTTTNSDGVTQTDSGVVIVTTDSAGAMITTTSFFVSASQVAISGLSTSSSGQPVSLSTASPMINSAALVGFDLITDISVHDNYTGSSIGYKDDLFTVVVTLKSARLIALGSIVQFTVPEVFYGNLNPFEVYSRDGEYVGTISSDDSNVFTILFDGSFGRTHTDIEAAFTFNVKLRYTTALAKRAELSLDLSRPVAQPFVFTTVSSAFTSIIFFPDVSLDGNIGEVLIGDVYVFSGDAIWGASNSAISTGYSATFSYWNSTLTATETGTSLVTVTSCANGNCHGTSKLISKTSSAVALTTVSVTKGLTVIVTITSCSNHICVPTTSEALASIATTTVQGEVVLYTTYCPLSSETGEKAAQEPPGAANGSNSGTNPGSNSGSNSGSSSNGGSGVHSSHVSGANFHFDTGISTLITATLGR